MEELKTKCLIIGSGPAGFTAGIYTSRANLEPIMVDGSLPGGQLMTTTEIENFPGYPEGIMGPAMMEDFRAQALKFGLKTIDGEVTEVDFSKRLEGVHDRSQGLSARIQGDAAPCDGER